jgi:hypothetical protein
MKIVLIGGHPKGFEEPFDIRTKSGKILRKITSELNIDPIFFDLWNNQKEEDTRIISSSTHKKLSNFIKNGYTLIVLGRYIEKAVTDSGYKCKYLPHPASRDHKYIGLLRQGLMELKIKL